MDSGNAQICVFAGEPGLAIHHVGELTPCPNWAILASMVETNALVLKTVKQLREFRQTYV